MRDAIPTSSSIWHTGWVAASTFHSRILPTFSKNCAVASRGGVADYYGITYERVDKQMGIFWPCPSLDHPGTPRLFDDKKFYTHDGKAHFNVTEWRPSGDPINDEYPVVPDHRPRGQPVSVRNANPPYRRTGGPESRTSSGDSSAPGGTTWNQRRRLDDGNDTTRLI